MRFSLSPAPASVKKSLKISSISMFMHFRTMWYQTLPNNNMLILAEHTFYQAVDTPRPFWITAWWAWVKMPFGVSLWCNAWWNILPITFFHTILPPHPTHTQLIQPEYWNIRRCGKNNVKYFTDWLSQGNVRTFAKFEILPQVDSLSTCLLNFSLSSREEYFLSFWVDSTNFG